MASTRGPEEPVRHKLSYHGPSATIRTAPKARSRPDLRPNETARLVLPGERESITPWLVALAILLIASVWWLILR